MAGKPNLRRNKFIITTDKNVSPKNRGVIKRGDARLRIIQKNRSKLVDARDRLAQMAKKNDARAKILKLRQLRTTGAISVSNETIRPVGSSILLKTDRNGKISLSTNKLNKNKAPTDIHTTIRKELGLVSNQRKMIPPPKNQMIRQIRQAPPIPFRNSERYNVAETYAAPPVIKRTIRNDIIRKMPPLPEYSQPLNQNLYTWVRPMARAVPETRKPIAMDTIRQSVEVTARNNVMMDQSEEEWNYADPSMRSFKMSSMFIDDEERDDSPPRIMTSAQRMKTGVHARLDTPAASSQSQGIFAHAAKTKVIVPVGHRIVVSNLQQTVTQDDIRELFEDIGELLVSRLVRPGTAEVIYKNLKDAQKAVDTYHNRQLDGQPMKCLLVNKRPVNNPTAPAVRPSKTTQSVLRTTGGITKKTIPNNKNLSNKLIPDISTIHKVLFHKT